jgi:hypothetical protein
MGWGRTLLLGDIGNRLDIEDTENDIADLRHRLAGSARVDEDQDLRIAALEEENDQLKLYLASLIRLLQSKGVVSREEINAVVQGVDL